MRKNKTIAFMMAGALLVGGTFLGTKAYFTDKVEASNNLVISMGKLDLEVEEGEWIYESTIHGDKEAMGTKGPINQFIGNVKPGDKFVKEVTISNYSDINTDLELTGGEPVKGSELESVIANGFITIKDNRDEVLKELNNNDSIQYENADKKATLRIEVQVNSRTPEQDNEYNREEKEEYINFNFDKDISKYVIDATQEGAKK
ncbi:hypothetical protein [Romboutsia sp. 1001216sp1]|uniref:hypothetical protein n=1 Tax=Romboutsia sp. 1001216sp1 TaxID=2986997 RepID=UPI00232B4205|nr:hypothetical protein [Romboutsia sp. 1001216sp1]MDB8804734.1 hypothetical protein [Romboutsia sp. 1001216sp1]MDB8806342.1 hypothetical protein [Romboutsia sp. 1001216sp1]MDB8810380.1 hypothetical protein [Romboutsia sp. 1001216sp1]MDB8817538.1 hypothetical protein [Romboutsia sp. 1001216sp1]MDB8818577.1 hypothetical protein [Romboutsia sp. 1001216sp1]